MKLVLTKSMKDKIPFVDLRVYRLFPGSQAYCRTSKGIYVSESDWIKLVLPQLNALFDQSYIKEVRNEVPKSEST